MLLLILASCSSGVIAPLPPAESASPPPATTPTPPPTDTEEPEDTAPVEDTEETTEVIPEETGLVQPPPEPLDLEVVPDGATFVGSVEVVLHPSDPDAIVMYALEIDGVEGPYRPYTAPITLTEAAVVRAYAYHEDALTGILARPFIPVAADAAAFTSNLPLIVLQSHEGAPTAVSEVRTPFLTIGRDPEGGVTSLVGEASAAARSGLRVRGSSSSGFPKKPYSLELWDPVGEGDNAVSLAGLPADADWVLYSSHYYDPITIRNAVIYELSNRIGVYAPRTRMVEVFLADRGAPVGMADYIGVYALTEAVGVGDERIDVAKIDPTDVAPPEVTGGYVFKRDRLGTGESGFSAGSGGGAFSVGQLVYVYPLEPDVVPEQRAYLTEVVNQFAAALAGPGFVHPTTGLGYGEYIDVASWMDHHLLNMLAKNPDAFRLSGYVHKDREGKLIAGPIWDFDRAMGSTDSRSAQPTRWDASNITGDTTFMFEDGWYEGLFDDPAFRAEYWPRYRALLDGALSMEQILDAVELYAGDLEAAAARDYARWPQYPPRGGSFASERALLEAWLADRHAWTVACIDDPTLADPMDCR
jgi:hypothetical protein